MKLTKKNQTELIVSNGTLIRVILFIIGAIIIFQTLDKLRHPLTLIFISIFLSIAINPAVHIIALKLKNKSRIRATAISYLVVISILVGFIILIVPPIFSQMSEFIQEVPDTLSNIQTEDSALGNFVRKYELETQVQNLSNDWSTNLNSVGGPIFSTAGRVLKNVISIITVLVLTFMMLIEGPKWLDIFWRYVPKDKRKSYKTVSNKMYKVITGYVNGQVIVAAMGAVFALVALLIVSTLLDVTINAVALAGIVFIFGLVPTVGAIISAVLVTISSLFVSPTLAFIMLIYFILYQQIENATIQPIIQSKSSALTPMLVFIAAVIGLSLAGVVGGFVAIPIAGCAKVLIDEFIANRNIAESQE